MVSEILDYFKIKLIVIGFLQPATLFPFSPFDFLHPLPVGLFKGLLGLMLIAAMLVTVGYQTKKAAFFFSIAYFYIIFLEKAYYNNHIYLFALLSFLLSIVNSDEHYSIHKRHTNEKIAWIPRWHLLSIQIQIIIVYFYGGLTKLGNDWLHRLEPIASSRKNIQDGVWYDFVKTDMGLKTFMYGGIIVDLILSLFLFHRKLKWIALPILVFFNLANGKIFNDIGIFPYLMIASLLLFFDKSDLALVSKSFKSEPHVPDWADPVKTSTKLGVFMVLFLMFQMLMPFRGHFFSKNMDWTGIHQAFSWRMKSMTRDIKEMKFVVVNGDTKQEIPITHGQIVNNMQVELLAKNAESILKFAKHLKSEAIKRGIPSPKVFAKILVSFNGRNPQLYVKSDIDLADPTLNMTNTSRWLMDLNE